MCLIRRTNMACATLKRHIDWEPVLGVRPNKRRRCNPLGSERSPSARIYRTSRPTLATTDNLSPVSSPSPFSNVVCPNITPGKYIALHYMLYYWFFLKFLLYLHIYCFNMFWIFYMNCQLCWFDLFIYICHQLFS